MSVPHDNGSVQNVDINRDEREENNDHVIHLKQKSQEPDVTHFHTACKKGCYEEVEKFLKRNQDANCLVEETGDSPLHLALRSNDTKVAELLLRNDANPNIANKAGLTPLHIVCKYSPESDIAEILFELSNEKYRPIQIDAQDNRGWTPLYSAVVHANVYLFIFLLDKGANPNIPNAEAMTPLHTICQRYDFERLVKMLVECSHAKKQPLHIDAQDKLGWTPLQWALNCNHRKLVQALLRNGANPNLANREGHTPLHICCVRSDDYALAEMLLKICEEDYQLVDVDARDRRGDTPLHLALHYGNSNTAELLLRHGADPRVANAQELTPLHIICKNNCVGRDLVNTLIELGKDNFQPVLINAQDNNGNSPLHLALLYNRTSLIEPLLRNGADPNLANNKGCTALHIVCKRCNDVDLVEMLFEISKQVNQLVQVNIQDNYGNSPLHFALRYNRTNLIESLMKNGADPNLANAKGSTALHIVCKYYRSHVLAEMLFKNCNDRYQPVRVNAQDNYGNTPLHSALLYNHKNLIKVLLENGADPDIANEEKSTALHIICQKKYSNDSMNLFFKIIDDIQHTVHVNARDTLGNTPLHLALERENKNVAELLLRRGADSNMANKVGERPLHICLKKDDDDLALMFFKINDDIQRTVQVNARDKWGCTSLELAVKNLLPDAIDALVDHGANLSGFVFPSATYFIAAFEARRRDIHFKLRLASGLMAVAVRLVKRGFLLRQSHARTIMKLFARYELFESSVNVVELLRGDEKLSRQAKKIAINSSLSLYDLIQLPFEEAEKLVSFSDYCELGRSRKLRMLPRESAQACVDHLCEKLARGFFQGRSMIPLSRQASRRLTYDCHGPFFESNKNLCLTHLPATVSERERHTMNSAHSRQRADECDRTIEWKLGRLNIAMHRPFKFGQTKEDKTAPMTLLSDVGETKKEPSASMSAQFNEELDHCMKYFEKWNDFEQINCVEQLLSRMCHYQHGYINDYLKPMLQRDFISLLPKKGLDHVNETILSYLDNESLAAAELVCKEWHRVISDGMLWKKLIERKVRTDSVWRGLAERRGWIQYLFKPRHGEHHPNHTFYRNLFPKITRDIKNIDNNWRNGNFNLQRINCRSENSKGVYCLQYDDQKIVSGLRDNTIKIWDRNTLQCVKVLTGHTGSVLCLQYDDKVIISGSSDSTVRVWDANTDLLRKL
ncbi:unnamed protein product [Trichogramma brassicae]|uniref:F-box domain-containing protein n=1 Tax=Trichogramma brassicae TaxID=86971 RepID=A0A6H5I275_9HYME|nr:unnamed protein product [Trichogramma brassicae]